VQTVKQVVKVLLVPIFYGGVPAPFPILEAVAGIDRHVVLGHAEKLVKAGFRLSQATFLRIARSKPAPDFINWIGDLTKSSNGLSAAPRGKEGDAAEPKDPIEIERRVPRVQFWTAGRIAIHYDYRPTKRFCCR
jgi:hypothetical protein